MALERKDRVKDQTATTGTGTVTIAGTAPAGYRTITSAHTTGATVRYTILTSDLSEWEVGQGVWTAAGTTLTRVTVYASSNAGALVNFSAGTKIVFTGPVAQDVMAGVFDGTVASAGVGPHVFGGAVNDDYQFWLTGTFAGAVNSNGLRVEQTQTVAANGTGSGVVIVPTLNKAGSGTHAAFYGVFINPPAIGAGAAALTEATTLKVAGAPTVGTTKYSTWLVATVAGDIRLDSATANGTVATVLGSLGPAGSNTTVQTWLTVNVNGTVRYLPCF